MRFYNVLKAIKEHGKREEWVPFFLSNKLSEWAKELEVLRLGT